MKVSRLCLVLAAVVVLSLVLTASSFAAVSTLETTGPNTVDASPRVPATPLNLSTLNRSNPIGWGEDDFGFPGLGPTGSIFDITNLGDSTPGDATLAIKMVRVPTAVFPTDYCAIVWTNSAAGPQTYDIYTLRPYVVTPANPKAVGGQIRHTIVTGTQGLRPTAASDPVQYKWGMWYQATTAAKGRLRVILKESRPGNPTFGLADITYDDPWATKSAPQDPTNPGVSWTSLAGNDVTVRFYAELKHNASVTPFTTSHIEQVNLPDFYSDSAALGIANNPAALVWGETGTTRAVATVTATNSGKRHWPANSTKLVNFNPGPAALTDNRAAVFAVTPSFTINAQVDRNGGATSRTFQLTAPVPPITNAINNNNVSGRYNTAWKLLRSVANIKTTGTKDFEFPTCTNAGANNLNVGAVIDVSRFGDVLLNGSFRSHVEMLAEAQVTLGTVAADFPNGVLPLYSPDISVDRRQMAAFLGRAAKFWVIASKTNPHAGAPGVHYVADWTPFTVPTTISGSAFDDVTSTSPLANWINAIAAPASFGMPAGTPAITLGCAAPVPPATLPTYCPDTFVTRGQMAAFLQRTFEIPKKNPPTPTFSDVPTTYPLYQEVEGIASLTLPPYPITAGCSPTQYCPDPPNFVSRLQMAIFLIRAGTAPDPQPPATTIKPAPPA